MKNKWLLILFMAVVIPANAQQAELLKKYWQFRDQYRKYFLHVGKDPGQSVPAEHITYANKAGSNIKLVNGTDVQQSETKGYHGTIQWGDVGVVMGDYMGVLATEYWLIMKERH